jgi:sRNA-binding carbon storage regulator CsrA
MYLSGCICTLTANFGVLSGISYLYSRRNDKFIKEQFRNRNNDMPREGTDMLVFGMKEADYVVISDNIFIRMKWDGNDVKLCIEAPRDIIIERDRIYENRCRMEGTTPKWKFDKLVKDKKKRLSGAGTAQGALGSAD